MNFIDTADVYGDGRSERLIARLRAERPRDKIFVATKAGRRLARTGADGYNRENLTRFVERSLSNLETDALDLLQLHCPPTEVYDRPEVFGVLDDLVRRRQAPLLRRQRRDDRGGAARDRVPQRPVRPDHLQHVPPATGRGVPRRGARRSASASSRACRWPAACSAAR